MRQPPRAARAASPCLHWPQSDRFPPAPLEPPPYPTPLDTTTESLCPPCGWLGDPPEVLFGDGACQPWRRRERGRAQSEALSPQPTSVRGRRVAGDVQRHPAMGASLCREKHRQNPELCHAAGLSVLWGVHYRKCAGRGQDTQIRVNHSC